MIIDSTRVLDWLAKLEKADIRMMLAARKPDEAGRLADLVSSALDIQTIRIQLLKAAVQPITIQETAA